MHLVVEQIALVGDAPGMFNPAAQGSCEIRRASVQNSAFRCLSFPPCWLGGFFFFSPHRRYIRTDLCGALPSFSVMMSNYRMSRVSQEQKAHIETLHRATAAEHNLAAAARFKEVMVLSF